MTYFHFRLRFVSDIYARLFTRLSEAMVLESLSFDATIKSICQKWGSLRFVDLLNFVTLICNYAEYYFMYFVMHILFVPSTVYCRVEVYAIEEKQCGLYFFRYGISVGRLM